MTKTEAAIADLAAALTGEQLTMLQPSEPLLATLKEFRAFLRDATPEQLTIIDHINDRLHARMSPTELVKLVHSPAEAEAVERVLALERCTDPWLVTGRRHRAESGLLLA
jgi:hypothetical protein